MKKKNSLRSYTLDELTDKYVGKRGTSKREAFEYKLTLETMGEAIKEARIYRNLTQEELGKLVGVQKAQISKLENNLTSSRLDTILRVFDALNAKIDFKFEMQSLRKA